jgi:2-polyprenyl-3-methyl-5-hydroxy-6-metoxy-1,4-benzoquinol methylase
MEYDPIKDKLSRFFGKSTFLQKLFYKLIDLLLRRAWHVHREIKVWSKDKKGHVHILDAGSGLGQYTHYLAEKKPNWSILGLDVKEEEIARCNEFFRKEGLDNVLFKTADLTKLDHENDYDLILCVDVMEHILDDGKVFQNFYKALKPEGMLLISTPSDQGGSDVTSEGESSFIGEHVRDGYNLKEIKQKLKDIGYSRVKGRYTYGLPGRISWRLSMKYPISMLNISNFFFIILPIYYLIVFPFCLILNYLDTHTGHSSGTGLIVKAWK